MLCHCLQGWVFDVHKLTALSTATPRLPHTPALPRRTMTMMANRVEKTATSTRANRERERETELAKKDLASHGATRTFLFDHIIERRPGTFGQIFPRRRLETLHSSQGLPPMWENLLPEVPIRPCNGSQQTSVEIEDARETPPQSYCVSFSEALDQLRTNDTKKAISTRPCTMELQSPS